MGALCQGLFGSSADTKYTPPPELKDALTKILNRAGEQSNQPYPQYTPERAAEYANYTPGLVAPMTPNQVMAGQTLAGLRGYTQPYIDAATGMVANAANPLQMQQFNQKSIDQYMNPYLNNVVGSAVANINQTNAQQQQQVLGNAIQKGAFGGDRAGIAQAELARQQGLANNATIANLLGQGYSQAQQQFNNQQQTDLATQLQNRNLLSTNALNLANLGTQGQQAAMQQGQAQYGYGTAEQQQDQANKSTGYQQYMNEQAFPYQQLSYYSGLASGTAPAWGGTTTGYSPTVAPAGGVLGSMSILGALSNPSSILANNPYSAASAGAKTIGSIFGFGNKDGGRINYDRGGVVGYADGGAPTNDSIIQAYNDYQALARSGHADPVVLQAAYDRYLKSTQGAPRPFRDSSTGVVAATPTTPKATTDTTKTTTPEGGGGPSRDVSDLTRGEGASDYNALGDQTGLDRFGGSGVRQGLDLGNLGKGLIGGVDQVTGAQTGISGAFDALLHGNSAGTLNKVLNANNAVASGKRADGSDYPNTTSGQTAQEFADQFAGGDINKVKGSIVRGQMEWFLDTPAGNFLHAGALPASQLTGFAKGVQQPESNQDIDTSEYTGPTDLGAAKPTPENPYKGMSKEEFISAIAPYAEKVSRLTGLTPETIMTQAALETGYGQHMVGGNLFGIKGTGTGAVDTIENVPGVGNVKQKASFAAYPGAQESFDAYGNLINTNPAYKGVLAAPTTAEQLAALGKSGYATDPQYGNKLKSFEKEVSSFYNPEGIGSLGGRGNSPSVQPNAGLGSFGAQGIGPSVKDSITQPGPASPIGLGGVGAASEGHGGSERDTSGDRANLYDRPAGPEMPDSMADGRDTEGAPQAGSEYSGEKRGGRIDRHHFADGGYEPFHMQYGLPSEGDIEQAAQDYAGSGAGVLNPQIQALATKGVLPSAKGGRIHAQTGVGISERDPANISERDPAADQAEYEARMKEMQESGGSPTFNGPTHRRSAINPGSQQPLVEDYTKRVVAPSEEAAAIAEMRAPSKTQPIIPKNPIIPNRPDEGGGTLPPEPPEVDLGKFTGNGAPEPKIVYAQAAPTTMNDATKEAAPGIKQWYNAPPPVDMRQMAGLNFGANLLAGGDFGSNLAKAGQNYANTMLAQQNEQRATMRNEAESALQRSLGIESGAKAAKEKMYSRGPFVDQLVTNLDGTISMIKVPGYESGFGGEAPSGKNGAQQFNVESYEPTPLDIKMGPAGSVGDTMESINKSSVFDKYSRTDERRVKGDPEGSRKQYEIDNQDAQFSSKLAKSTQNNLYQQAIAITKLPDHGPLKAGAGSQWRIMAYDYFKTALPPGTLASIGVENPDDLANSYVANKIATIAAEKLGDKSAAVWKTMIRAAQPGTDLPKAASNELMTAALVSQKQDRDNAVVMQEYGNRTMGYGPSGAQIMADVNPPALYMRDQQILRDIFDNKSMQMPDPKNPGSLTIENPATLLMQKIGKVTPEKFDKWVDETYGSKYGVKHFHLSQYLQ